MNVSSWSIKNPIPAVMLFVMLTFAGMLSFNSMKVQQFPDLELPNIIISASLPGAAPAQLETEVARKIENAIASLQGLKNIYTKVQDGGVTITAEFRLEKPTQEAVDDVRSAVQGIRSELPSDVRDPVVSKVNLSGSPIMALTIRSAKMDDEALSWFVDNTIARRLLGVKGVGSVVRVGGVTRQVEVALDPMKLQALGATAADISRQLKQVQTESAGGRADLGGSEQPMRTLATVKSAEELARMELTLSNGQRLRLADVATVKDTIAEPRALALLNGVPVVGIGTWDLDDVVDAPDPEAAVADILAADRRVRLDLAQPPVLRCLLLRLGPASHRLVLTNHHILMDGWSLPVLVRELLATLKHYAGHSFSEGARNHAPVHLGWRELNDTFLLPFEMAVKDGKVAALMCSYNYLNGQSACENRMLLTDVLRRDWGFTGYVQSDFFAVKSTVATLANGLDHEMPKPGFWTPTKLTTALDKGDLTLAQIADLFAFLETSKNNPEPAAASAAPIGK